MKFTAEELDTLVHWMDKIESKWKQYYKKDKRRLRATSRTISYYMTFFLQNNDWESVKPAMKQLVEPICKKMEEKFYLDEKTHLHLNSCP